MMVIEMIIDFVMNDGKEVLARIEVNHKILLDRIQNALDEYRDKYPNDYEITDFLEQLKLIVDYEYIPLYCDRQIEF